MKYFASCGFELCLNLDGRCRSARTRAAVLTILAIVTAAEFYLESLMDLHARMSL
jgi:hypothetical protein